ncbi:hypothetical protein D9Q98_009635 [Chlorella vulgaris]|uniref:Coilin tudor domain-containing protein n=1 Tax=Chlorella vulgaris TaxID=3077 RepID=A0A9D4TER6_CHLVU|nr:hypothetical protein D9Q98_009635 [Chlorella vulgaris]
MQRVRLRVTLAFHHAGPSKFWWQPVASAETIGDLLDELGSELGLQPSHVPRLEATLDAFALLRGSKTDVLRDGDALLVNLSRKRGFAIALAGDGEPQHKRHKAEAEVQAVATLGAVSGSSDSSESSLEGSSSDDEESSEEESSDEESSDSDPNAKGQDLKTPAAVKLVDGNTTAKKQPSRSARRKSAKRRLRRMGVLPQGAGPQLAVARQSAEVKPQQPIGDKPSSRGRPVGSTVAAAVTTAVAKPAAVLPSGAAKHQRHAPVTQAFAPPDVVVPPEWQPRGGGGSANGPVQQQPQQQQHPHTASANGALHAKAVPPAAATPAVGEPMTEAAFGRLQPLPGMPCLGDVLAYKLLEIGADFQPAVSEVRCGRVAGLDAAAQVVTLEPHPDPQAHPLSFRRAQALAWRREEAGWGEAEVEEEDEDLDGPGNQYDEAGMLTAELSSFVELRMLRQAAPLGGSGRSRAIKATATAGLPAAAQAQGADSSAAAEAMPAGGSNNGAVGGGPGVQAQAQAASVDLEDLGPSSYSQLGPPRAAATRGDVIEPEGGWAALYAQLRERRTQLAYGGAAPTPPAATRKQAAAASAAAGTQSAPPAARSREGGSAGTGVAGRGSLTPGATRPRAGVRSTALGPMLRMLRDNQELA